MTNYAAGLCLGLSLGTGTAQAADIDRFAEWFSGEFNNHAQVWQQDIDKVTPSPHLHTTVTRVDGAEGMVFHLRQADGVDLDRSVRDYLWVLEDKAGAVQVTLKTPRLPGRAKAERAQDWQTLEGCASRWQLQDGVFRGELTDAATCAASAADSGAAVPVGTTLSLDSELLSLDLGVYDNTGQRVSEHTTVSRKVRWFSGWAGVRKDRVDASAGEDEWIFAAGLRIHNEGQRIPLKDKDGSESGFEIQLARLLQQRAKVNVLVLKLFRTGEDKAFAYTWTEVGSTRAGINLRWIQTGWTAESCPKGDDCRARQLSPRTP